MVKDMTLQKCFRDPIPEIYTARDYLDEAVTAHLLGNTKNVSELIKLADMPVIREWTESIWGANSPYVLHRKINTSIPILAKDARVKARMPNSGEKNKLHQRDGFHCRFCGVPLIRKEVRMAIKNIYPEALQWGTKHTEQHSAFQAMWLQYDHLLPHARGGNNDLDNIVITCAPCNYGRTDNLIEEVGLLNPFLQPPVQSSWDGLERFLK